MRAKPSRFGVGARRGSGPPRRAPTRVPIRPQAIRANVGEWRAALPTGEGSAGLDPGASVRRRPSPRAEDGSALNMYLREVHEVPLLSREEEHELAVRAASGETCARNMLVQANLRLVVWFARVHWRRGLETEDLIQEGNLGLVRAAETFDPNRGVRFVTHALWHIRGAMGRAVAERGRAVRLPEHCHTALHRIRAAEDLLRQRLASEPSAAQVGAWAGMTAQRVDELRVASRDPISLDQLSPEERTFLYDRVRDELAMDPADLVGARLCRQSLEETLSRLPPRLQTVLRLRHGLDGRGPLTLEAVGKILGVNRRRSHQLEHKAYRLLRSPANVQRLDELR